MVITSLFFATNRKHRGNNQWSPSGYGKNFSKDGMQNLRFGELKLQVNERVVQNFLTIEADGRQGDGEQLAKYLTGLVKKAKITAYKEETADADEEIPSENNPSTKLFKSLKKLMENAADVVVYIHGYNVSWEEAVGAAMALQYMFNKNRDSHQKDVVVVLFSWPSDGSLLPFAAYKSDRSDAEGSGHAVGRAILKLRDFLVRLRQNSLKQDEKLCNQEIHLLCHSMGNYVLQNALGKMIEHAEGPSLPRIFDHLFLCSADVNDDVLETDQPMSRLHELGRNITIYFNKGDIALRISDSTKGNPERLGHSGNAHPYLVHNKVHQADCSQIVGGLVEHSYYLWATVNEDIRLSIEGIEFDDNNLRRRQRRGHSNEWVLK